MAIYHANEFILGLPDVLKDKTVHIFALTDEGPSDLSVVVARERPKSGETLEKYTERHLQAMLGRLPVFRLLRREDTRVDNQPAALVDFTWQTTEGKMFQRQVILYAKAQHLMLVITATCRESLSAKWESLFNDFLAGFRLRSG